MSSTELRAENGDILSSIRRMALDVDLMFDIVLPVPKDPSRRLIDAMRYATMGGGKRLRPLLVSASAALFGVPERQSLRAGLVIECIHAHSLIHDDLPCMDNDDLRRGKPTVHIAFDEATAVLAGDALLALAFELLCDPDTHPDPQVRAELTSSLASAAGAWGMAGGQMLDLLHLQPDADMDAIARLQRLKTGALINWSVEAGAVLGNASSDHRTSLRGYAQKLGLAFQIADDLLDHDGDPAVVGKKVRKDEKLGKATFVTLLGAPRARAQAQMLVDQAKDHLRCFGSGSDLLASIADFAITRSH